MRAMGLRSIVAIALLLPETLLAQLIPLGPVGGRRPGGPTHLPPQPPEIVRQLAYQRMRVSFESYPMMAYFAAPGLFGAGGQSYWSSAGIGTRADYRITDIVSATFDMTDTFLGGPLNTATAELGMRFHPRRSNRRVYPFVDVRAGYMAAYGGSRQFTDVYGPPVAPFAYGAAFTDGYGAGVGTGAEFVLSRSFSLTTAASVLRGTLRSNSWGAYGGGVSARMTSVRYTLGLRYNPVRMLRANDRQ